MTHLTGKEAHLGGNKCKKGWEANSPLRHGQSDAHLLQDGLVPEPLDPAPGVLQCQTSSAGACPQQGAFIRAVIMQLADHQRPARHCDGLWLRSAGCQIPLNVGMSEAYRGLKTRQTCPWIATLPGLAMASLKMPQDASMTSLLFPSLNLSMSA